MAIDIAPEMIEIHPAANGVETMVGDFNDPELFKILKKREFDLFSNILMYKRRKDGLIRYI